MYVLLIMAIGLLALLALSLLFCLLLWFGPGYELALLGWWAITWVEETLGWAFYPVPVICLGTLVLMFF